MIFILRRKQINFKFMRKYIPYLDFFTTDLKEAIPASQGKALTRRNYRTDFEDYDLFPVDLDLIEVWWEEEESLDTMIDHGHFEEEEDDDDDNVQSLDYVSFLPTDLETTEILRLIS
jgi:hypothetical protein